MSDDELRHLNPDEVVVRFRHLEGELAPTQARIAELEAERARRGGPPFGHLGRSRQRTNDPAVR